MVSLAALWLPILLSAVFVFVAASIIWMALPHHKKDWSQLPGEDGVFAELMKNPPAPGMYFLPHYGTQDRMKDPEYQQKVRGGRAVFMQVWPGGKIFNMGPALMQTFVYYLIISTFLAYIGSQTLPIGTAYMTVFQVIGTAGILAYAGALFPKAIYFGYRWSMVWKEMMDGVVYALLTAGVFGWLWPAM